MIDKKTIRDWCIFICILLFLPKDNKLAFEFRPQDWYGELRIVVGDRLVIIGKNASTDSVRHGVHDVQSAVSLQVAQPDGIDVTSDGRALPTSVSIISAPRRGNEHREAYLDDNYYFAPGSLSILTRADLYNAFLLLGAVVAMFMILGALLSRFAVDDGRLWSTEAPQTEPNQQ